MIPFTPHHIQSLLHKFHRAAFGPTRGPRFFPPHPRSLVAAGYMAPIYSCLLHFAAARPGPVRRITASSPACHVHMPQNYMPHNLTSFC